MARLPLVAIIGRPNTGKSTLFNRMVHMRKAIVSEIPGTTRDHVSHTVNGDIPYHLIDTGGIGKTRDTEFEADVTAQAKIGLENADLILFTINSREDLTVDDRKVIDLLRKNRKKNVPVITVLTKVDTPGKMRDEAVIDETGVGDEVLPISAEHNLGIEELEEAIVKYLHKLGFKAEDEKEEVASDIPKIAVIGKPNVGKSSIVNALMSQADREVSPRLVSPIAGTTRDAVDTDVKYHDKVFTLIDTAGLKRHSRDLDEIERYSMLRTETAVERSDVVLLVIDGSQPVTQQDKKIAAIAVDSGKGLIILINKIDQTKGEARKAKVNEVIANLQFCRYAKVIPCSATTKEGLTKLFDVVDSVQQSRTRRLSTRELMRWFERIVHGQPLGEVASTKYITQGKEIPPTFVLFVRNPKRVSVSQLRYLDNRLRETFGFDGTPIRWITRGERRKEVEERKIK